MYYFFIQCKMYHNKDNITWCNYDREVINHTGEQVVEKRKIHSWLARTGDECFYKATFKQFLMNVNRQPYKNTIAYRFFSPMSAWAPSAF